MAVRVVDMRGVDLARYVFDWDLTFAALLMHADGTILHRYGGRDHRSPGVWLSEASFARFLREGLASHAAYAADPHPPEERAPRRIEEIPAFRPRDKGECIHCHSIFPALHEEALAQDSWRPDDLWLYPPPARIGLDLDRDDQRRVTAVEDGTPASRAGVRVGDRLAALDGRRLLTASDLSAALHDLSPQAGRVELEVERDGARRALALELDGGWKRGTPLSFSWRPFKWGLLPAPGFGGPLLTAPQKRELGLDEEAFAFRVQYLVTWGENRRFGQAAARAGLRQGTVVLGTGSERDFRSVDHFHAWWRLTREPGETVEIVTWEQGAERALRLTVLE